MRGKIVNKVEGRGFGFIRADGAKTQHFYHREDCDVEFDAMPVGMYVSFEEKQTERGLRATKVTPVILNNFEP